MSHPKPKTLLWFGSHTDSFLTEDHLDKLRNLVDLVIPTRFDHESFLSHIAEAELVISTWGFPRLDQEILSRAPQLKAVFYAAGTVKGWVTPAVWERKLHVTSAASSNAVPVCHYTVSMILLSLKNVLPMTRTFQDQGRKAWDRGRYAITGAGSHSRIGIIGASKVGRLVMAEMKRLGLEMLVFDPYLSAEAARKLGAGKVELNELLSQSDIISIHAPRTEETHHLLNTSNLGLIKKGATLINTARGDLIDETALVVELRKGEWTAVLDVTEPEPPLEGSELYRLPNCFLTPHVAGSLGYECRLMATQAIEELELYLSGQPALEQVREQDLRIMA
ncbi:MAG: hydroxyacid dehydrogenase [Blastochloris sp.]|nr:hydroxyacid dehydrogenase [Blastochloris sp.]